MFYDFGTINEATNDSDGMRCDTQGNLYVTRHGLGKITVLSPGGAVLSNLPLGTITHPTNLEFGGADGTTLCVVGRCSDSPGWAQGDGCVETLEVSYPGRQWDWFENNLDDECTTNP